MTTTLTSEQIQHALLAVADVLIANKDELTTLDAELGDGDLGRTVSRGFAAIKEKLAAGDTVDADVGKMLFKNGKEFSNSAPSSFGALFGTVLMTSGKSLRGNESVPLSAIADAAQDALEALMERGKANIGDKTMLDAMQPAIEAMRTSITDNGDGVETGVFFRSAAVAAQKGAEETKDMQSQIGRASWQQERSAGKMDPGARAIAMMLDAAAEHFEA